MVRQTVSPHSLNWCTGQQCLVFGNEQAPCGAKNSDKETRSRSRFFIIDSCGVGAQVMLAGSQYTTVEMGYLSYLS